MQLSCLIHAAREKHVRWQYLRFPSFICEEAHQLQSKTTAAQKQLRLWKASFLPPVNILIVTLSSFSRTKEKPQVLSVELQLDWSMEYTKSPAIRYPCKYMQVGNQFKHSMLSLLAGSNDLNQRTLFYRKKHKNIQICYYSAVSSTREEFLILMRGGCCVCVDRNLKTFWGEGSIQQNKHLSLQHDIGVQPLGKHLTRSCSVCSHQR